MSKRHGDVSVIDYRNKGYLPEALVNGLALLGWNPPHREEANAVAADANHFLRSEVLEMIEMEKLFKIDKVGKSGVKFDEKKLEYLNSQHIRNKFEYFEDVDEKMACVKEWRQVMLKALPNRLHTKIRNMSDSKMLLIMDMMKKRIHFYDALLNHTYFFEKPEYNTDRSRKFAQKLKQPNEVKIEILEDLQKLFDEQKAFSADSVNKTCSLYLYENKERGFKNEDVFFLLRYALTGNPVGGPTGEIAEVIGQAEMMARIEDCLIHLKS